MDKVKGSLTAMKSLQLTDKAPQLDEASKELLSTKEFLAVLLKYTVEEYADMSYQEIAACIETVDVGEVDVAPGKTNAGRIDGGNTESAVMNERLVKFDVFFKSANPQLSNDEKTYFLRINIEPQNNYRPGYPLEKRGVFYLSRMISSQLPAPTNDAEDYNGLEKSYTIWICRDRIPEGLRNTISVFEFTNTWNNKDIVLDKSTYGLMTMVIVRLGDPDGDTDEDVFRILNALLYPRDAESYKVLGEYIDFSELLERRTTNMMGLGESVFYEGVERGIEQGLEQGLEQGEVLTEVRQIRKKVSKNLSPEAIAAALELDEGYVLALIHMMDEHPGSSERQIANLFVNAEGIGAQVQKR